MIVFSFKKIVKTKVYVNKYTPLQNWIELTGGLEKIASKYLEELKEVTTKRHRRALVHSSQNVKTDQLIWLNAELRRFFGLLPT